MTKSITNTGKAIWTTSLVVRLCDLYPDHPAEKVAELLGLRKSQVYNKAYALALKKSDAFKASDKSVRIARLKQSPAMAANQFQKGATPWNYGRKGWDSGGRSVETRFTKGRRPEESRNYRPIGSLRISKDGYLERKITDDKSLLPSRRWAAVHRLVWEDKNGPIPARHIVVFKPGMATTDPEQITLEKLECITRSENMRRNSFRTSSPELNALYQLKGAINRQVNRIKREANEQSTH